VFAEESIKSVHFFGATIFGALGLLIAVDDGRLSFLGFGGTYATMLDVFALPALSI
jgi:hypothetical protein